MTWPKISTHGTFRLNGRVFVAVMALAGNGDGRSQQLADAVADIFRASLSIPDISFKNIEVTRVGIVGDRFRQNVRASFDFEITRATM